MEPGFTSIRVAEIVANILFHALWISLAGFLLMLGWSRRSAPVRHTLSRMILVILLLLPWTLLVFQSGSKPLIRISLHSPAGERVGPQPAESTVIIAPPTSELLPTELNPKSSTGGKKKVVHQVLSLFLVVFGMTWTVGTLIRSGLILAGFAKLARFKRGLTACSDIRLHQLVIQSCARVQLGVAPDLLQSAAGLTPMSFGLLRPTVVIPVPFDRDHSWENLRCILDHELAHIRHRDHLTGLLQRLSEALYWWNPLIHKINMDLSVAIEEISDNHAIQGNGPLAYVQAVIEAATQTYRKPRAFPAHGFTASPPTLEARIRKILAADRNLATKAGGITTCIAGITIVICTTFLALYGRTFPASPVRTRVIPLPELRLPVAIEVTDDRIIIPQKQTISFYSSRDFRWLRDVGRPGEAPGEFLYEPHVSVYPDHILVNSLHKLMVYSSSGELIEEKRLPFAYNYWTWPLRPVGPNFFGFPLEVLGNGSFTHVGQIYNERFTPIRQIGAPVSPPVPPPPPPPRPGRLPKSTPKQEYPAIPDYVDYEIDQGLIYLADTRHGFSISVYNPEGNLARRIEKPYARNRVSREFREDYWRQLRERRDWEVLRRRYRYTFKSHFPAFFSFKISDGKIYVATYNRRGPFHELIVMDLQGNILKRSYSFPLTPDQRFLSTFRWFGSEYDIHGDQIYYLTYDQDRDRYLLNIQPID